MRLQENMRLLRSEADMSREYADRVQEENIALADRLRTIESRRSLPALLPGVMRRTGRRGDVSTDTEDGARRRDPGQSAGDLVLGAVYDHGEGVGDWAVVPAFHLPTRCQTSTAEMRLGDHRR